MVLRYLLLLCILAQMRISAKFCDLEQQPIVAIHFNKTTGSFEKINYQVNKAQKENGTALDYILVRSCYCANLVNQNVQYCPVEYRKCSINVGVPLHCFTPKIGVSIVRASVPTMFVWYSLLGLLIVDTVFGRNTRGYIYRKVRCWQNRDQEILEQQTDQLKVQFPDRAAALFQQGLRRRRIELQQERERSTRQDQPIVIADEQPTDGIIEEGPLTTEMFLEAMRFPIPRRRPRAVPTEERQDGTQLKLKTKTYSSTDHSTKMQNSLKVPHESATDSSTNNPAWGRRTLQAFRRDDGLVEVELCAICLDPFVTGDRIGDLNCQHDFHVSCLKAWLKRKNQCPLCKTKNVAALVTSLPGLEGDTLTSQRDSGVANSASQGESRDGIHTGNNQVSPSNLDHLDLSRENGENTT